MERRFPIVLHVARVLLYFTGVTTVLGIVVLPLGARGPLTFAVLGVLAWLVLPGVLSLIGAILLRRGGWWVFAAVVAGQLIGSYQHVVSMSGGGVPVIAQLVITVPTLILVLLPQSLRYFHGHRAAVREPRS
ncbi:pheromone shutdown protein TraB [Spinactinospora alkalitolerans]|uniref:Pheromone shutdown protein TraB n=1 Tax=Spinactinospora alkalitolerans TaxID=687207 RepID=A0A852TPY2_9ACTN|nr:hypothetical protein [Spinactinospora alkalitolerans]NYE45561.1 pheromone shutdown protein TraB [Spinactinospora alkalitolerans]